jgi:hypothetical protein
MTTRGNTKEGKTQRKINGWMVVVRGSMTNRALTEEGITHRGVWKKLV